MVDAILIHSSIFEQSVEYINNSKIMNQKFVKSTMLAVLGTFLLGVFVSPAAAYVDPSVMTYAIQAIAGVVIVVGVSVGVIWRRFKRKAAKVLHIDENAGKEVEADVVAVNPETEERK